MKSLMFRDPFQNKLGVEWVEVIVVEAGEEYMRACFPIFSTFMAGMKVFYNKKL